MAGHDLEGDRDGQKRVCPPDGTIKKKIKIHMRTYYVPT